jgi:uncharacterized protein (TIGR02246 family)
MKKLLMILPLVIMLCFSFSCQKAEELVEEPAVDVEAMREVIHKINDEFDAASNAGDAEKVVSIFTDDAVRIPAAGPTLVGKEAIKDWLQQLFDQYTIDQKNVLVDFKVSGDLTFFRGTWTTTNTPKEGGNPLKLNGDFIVVLKKQSDGSWKTICNSWSNEQLIRPWEEK